MELQNVSIIMLWKLHIIDTFYHCHSCLWLSEVVLVIMHLINRNPFTLTFFIRCLVFYQMIVLCVSKCTFFVLLPIHECTKLSAKSHMCVFLSYGVSLQRYQCFDPSINWLYVSDIKYFRIYSFLFIKKYFVFF